MTSLIDNMIDELIKRVRQRTAVSEMAFVSAYPPRELPNPVDKYLVTVENRGVRNSQVFIGDTVGTGLKGRIVEVSLRLRTYAPRHTSASALLRMTSQLYDAVLACDSDSAVTDISLHEVEYENAARTCYRDLRVTLSWLLCGEGA